jgi:hypothetical protein
MAVLGFKGMTVFEVQGHDYVGLALLRSHHSSLPRAFGGNLFNPQLLVAL